MEVREEDVAFIENVQANEYAALGKLDKKHKERFERVAQRQKEKEERE